MNIQKMKNQKDVHQLKIEKQRIIDNFTRFQSSFDERLSEYSKNNKKYQSTFNNKSQKEVE